MGEIVGEFVGEFVAHRFATLIVWKTLAWEDLLGNYILVLAEVERKCRKLSTETLQKKSFHFVDCQERDANNYCSGHRK